MSGQPKIFAGLEPLVGHLRGMDKKYILLFAHNGTGKTRLSMAFKEAGKNAGAADTLYFNAFTEDLFHWDNDLDGDAQRRLLINKDSRFIAGMQELEMESRIRPLLARYADINFLIDYTYQDKDGRAFYAVNFIREVPVDGSPRNIEYIKISRGEENLFVWCFFLTVAQLAIDRQPPYDWVQYLYIDDPVSSLDDNNIIAIAHHLAGILKTANNPLRTIISTHHALFFNVVCNELSNRAPRLLLSKSAGGYVLEDTSDSPFFYHLSLIRDLQKATTSGSLYTFHFSMLRTVLEKAANFHGFNGFADCLIVDEDDADKTLFTRMVNILNHGTYSIFEPREMGEENRKYFKQIFANFLRNYKFNDDLFDAETV